MILSKGVVGNPLKAPEKTIENLPTLIDRTVFPGLQGGPLMNMIAAKAVAFEEALQPEFKIYATQVVKNAKALADALMERGFKLITNGTDNHLMLVDMQISFGVDGKLAEETFDKIGLTLNKNAIPNDTAPPYRPSGVRLGTPAITTRGLVEADMATIAEWMKQAIEQRESQAKLEALGDEVKQFALRFPLPSDS